MEKTIQNKKEVRTALALGGLLHDIGKVIVRMIADEEIKRTFPQLGKEIAYKDRFKYAHAYITHVIIDNFFKGAFSQYPILEASAYHHLPKSASDEQKLFAKIYQLADQYSSVERSELERKSEIPFLRPIFQTINLSYIEHSKKQNCNNSYFDQYFYNLSPLDLQKKTIFPEKLEKSKEKDFLETIKFNYKKHFKAFEEELQKGLEIFFTSKKLEDFLYIFYHLCYKYFWCVPASTYDPERKEKHYPDISLFDHLRVTAAFSTSLWTDYNLSYLKSDTRNSKKNLKLLFIKGDISGIQKFLYNVKNIKGIAKRLRGRSLFLTFLSDLVSQNLVNRLDYPFVNILFTGGGHFEVVLGYEKDIEEKLEEFRKEVEELLFKEFKGNLSLALSVVPITLSELKEGGYREINKRHFIQLDKQKKRKFASLFKNMASYEEIFNLINSDYLPEEGKVFEICKSCNINIVEEKAEEPDEEKICSWCKKFKNIGEEVPRAEFLLYSPEKLPNFAGFYLNNLGGFYFLKKNDLKFFINSSRANQERKVIYLLNNTDFLKKEYEKILRGFKFVGKSVPVKEEDGKKEVMSFEELVEKIEGDKKLAFARADVDNLGLIFMKGLGEDYSISRIATLSRSLDLFFSGYLNKLFESKEYKDKIYTLYAGGDDLFIIGPWDIVFKAIKDVRDNFKQYTCNNPDINLSCGIFIARHNYPVRFAGDEAGKLEDKAKDEKPAICALNEVLKWEDYIKALAEGEEMSKFLNNRKIGRTLFYKFYQLIKEYRIENGEENMVHYKFYPMFYYYLCRNVKKEEDRKYIEEFILDTQNNYRLRENVMFKIKYVLMKTREN